MMRGPVAARLLSPGGFVLAASCFVMPFVTVSCSPGAGSTMSATYRGLDLVTGAPAKLSATSKMASRSQLREIQATEGHLIGVQPLLLVVLVLAITGLAAVFLRHPLVRATAGASMAAAAAIVLVGGEIAARRAVWGPFETDARSPVGGDPTTGGWLVIVRTGVGFWAALILLIAVGAGNLVGIVRHTRRGPSGTRTGKLGKIRQAGSTPA